MKPYPKYKPTNIPWIEDIPKNWEKEKFKYRLNYQKGKNPKELKTMGNGKTMVYLAMDYLRDNPKQLYYVDDYENYVVVDKEEILLLWDGSNAGEFIWSKKGVLSSTMAVIKNENINGKYCYYFLKAYERILKSSTIGMGIPHVNGEELKNSILLIPSKEEQILIAQFLDKKTTEIDNLIAQKQKLINLLEEEKKAIINKAVTKGISPKSKVKESGISWIGRIPIDWEIKPLKYVGKCQNGISKSSDYFGSGFPFVSYGDVYKNIELPSVPSGLAQSTDDDRLNFSIEKGDVLFTRTSETVEEIAIASTCLKTIEDAVFAGFLIRFRPHSGLLFEGFSKYYFRSEIHRNFFVSAMNIVTRASLSQDLLKKLPVLLPRINEQKQIADFLDKSMGKITGIIESTQKEIELIQEYKAALISEAVTGKIDIRNYKIK